MTVLATQSYLEQINLWPTVGRHILAHFDDRCIVVYQSYNPAIARFAVKHGRFGGDFSFARMSWIKPGFLWIMHRSGWGTKRNQEITLALRIRRSFFESILAAAVPSKWDSGLFESEDDWYEAVSRSSVRLQWDPDHHPDGTKLERRAIQLGLRGDALESFGQRELLEIIDLSAFVAEQRSRLTSEGLTDLITPVERVYRPADPMTASRLRLDEELPQSELDGKRCL